jgi:tripartite-type tricarboxylate transporter receptor subunit TctC
VEEKMKRTLQILAASVAALAVTQAQAEDGAAFFKDKTVTYIVATSPGGGYDSYGRLVAEYMQRALPGSTFVVKNMPGAGHIIGTNAIYASKPDGLTIGTFNTGLIYNQIVNAQGVKFDLSKMSWIGKAASDPRVVVIASQSPIKSFADLQAQKTPVNFATAGPGSASYVETVILTNTLKLPVKNLTGYNGTDDQLAMRRGEVVGSIASRSSYTTFIENGYGRLIAQIGGNDKDVPQLSSLVKDAKALDLIALVQSQGDIARLTAGPPAIPADRMKALIEAYKAAMENKELQARAEKLEKPVEPAYGEDVAKAIAKALNQSDETKQLLAEALKSDKK